MKGCAPRGPTTGLWVQQSPFVETREGAWGHGGHDSPLTIVLNQRTDEFADCLSRKEAIKFASDGHRGAQSGP